MDKVIVFVFILLLFLQLQCYSCKSSDKLLVVELKESGNDIEDVAGKFSLQVVSKVFPDENYYFLKSKNNSITSDLISKLAEEDNIKEVLPQNLKFRKTRILKETKIRYDKGGDIPEINIAHHLYHREFHETKRKEKFNDPYYPDQWYINNYGQTGLEKGHDINVLKVWDAGLTGDGIILSVLDDGIQEANKEIKDNFDSSVSFDYIDNKPDMQSETLDNSHGTYCAAIIAAVANNHNCGVGIAYNSKVGGTRLINGPVTDVQEALALTHALDKVDIFSASWGPRDDGTKIDGPSTLARQAFREGVTKGRDGKGVIYVWAAGNGGGNFDNCNLDGYVSNMYSISVGAVTGHGQNTYYSEPCSSLLASTYIGGSHVQIPRENLFQDLVDIKVIVPNINGECVESFQGTSAAAPMAAGMISLMLEANYNLSWRDVQHIVVRSAKIPTTSPVPYGWKTNGAGFHFNLYLGFGVLDAARMVNLAQNWTNVPSQLVHIRKITGLPKKLISNFTFLNTLVNPKVINSKHRIEVLEHVLLRISLKHTKLKNIKIILRSPSGTESTLLTERKLDNSSNALHNWDLISVHFWGENPTGTWVITIADSSKVIDTKRLLQSCELIMYGSLAFKNEPKRNNSLKVGRLNLKDLQTTMNSERNHSTSLKIRKKNYSKEVLKKTDSNIAFGLLNLLHHKKKSKTGLNLRNYKSKDYPAKLNDELRVLSNQLDNLYEEKIKSDLMIKRKELFLRNGSKYRKEDHRIKQSELLKLLALIDDLQKLSI